MEMSDAALALLRTIEWYNDTPRLPECIESWLKETGSMTQRLECHCEQLTVVPFYDDFIAADLLGEEREALPESERYWLREVIMYGDGQSWLVGRTVIPPSALEASSSALMSIGDKPLGHYLFQQEPLARDYIHIGRSQDVWARRSRLRLFDQPLLITELFLPASPAYRSPV